MRDDRDGAALGETLELVDRFGRQGRRYDQRALGGSDPFGQCCDCAGIGIGRGRLWSRFCRPDRFRQCGRERFARQHQVDRSAWMRHGDFDAARHDISDLARHAQFVIPLHELTHHAGLIEHLLRPVDRT